MNTLFSFGVLLCVCLAYALALPDDDPTAAKPEVLETPREILQPEESRWGRGWGYGGGYGRGWGYGGWYGPGWGYGGGYGRGWGYGGGRYIRDLRGRGGYGYGRGGYKG